jgi:hypothetical protein
VQQPQLVPGDQEVVDLNKSTLNKKLAHKSSRLQRRRPLWRGWSRGSSPELIQSCK